MSSKKKRSKSDDEDDYCSENCKKRSRKRSEKAKRERKKKEKPIELKKEDVIDLTDDVKKESVTIELDFEKDECVDCGAKTDMRLYGSLPAPLCAECREGYVTTTPKQNFVTRTVAKTDYNLHEDELKTLPYGFCTNPLNFKWAPMNLFLKEQIENLTREKFGSIKHLKKMKHDRMIRRELSAKDD